MSIERRDLHGPQFKYSLNGMGKVEFSGDGMEGFHDINFSGMRNIAQILLHIKSFDENDIDDGSIVAKGRFYLEFSVDKLISRLWEAHSVSFPNDYGSIGFLHKAVKTEMSVPIWFASLRDHYWPAFTAWLALITATVIIFVFLLKTSRGLGFLRFFLCLITLLNGAAFVFTSILEGEYLDMLSWLFLPCIIVIIVASFGALKSFIFLSTTEEVGRKQNIFTSTVTYETMRGPAVLVLGAMRLLIALVVGQVANITFLVLSMQR